MERKVGLKTCAVLAFLLFCVVCGFQIATLVSFAKQKDTGNTESPPPRTANNMSSKSTPAPSTAAPVLKLTVSSGTMESGGEQGLKIQISSDLHTEFYGDYFEDIPEDIVIPRAPVLALVGDIGLANTETLRQFLHFQTERFEQVLFLAGNHEYYNHGNQQDLVSNQQYWMQEVCGEKENLHFLDGTTVLEINGVVVLGTTLWSHVPDATAARAQQSMNDYHLSYQAPQQRMTVAYTNQEFTTSLDWLERQIQQHRNKPIVVLTHHTPSLNGTSDPIYDGSELSTCFSTDLTRLLQDPVKLWASGHTHYNFDMEFNNCSTRLVSNQRGYPGKEVDDYDPEGIVVTIPAASDVVAATPNGGPQENHSASTSSDE